MAVYHFTGQPLIDVGIAALMAYAGRTSPQDITLPDMAKAADWLANLYTTHKTLQGFLHGSVLLNTGYRVENDDTRTAYVQRLLYSWRDDSPHHIDAKCGFCGASAAYRAGREEIPLLMGGSFLNFSPQGRGGVPICGRCSLASQMLVFGAFKSGGGLVVVHSDVQTLMVDLARDNLRRMQQALALALESGEITGMVRERTRIVEMLVKWLSTLERRDIPLGSVTAYFIASGKTPQLRIYRLDSAVLYFLDAVLHHPDATLSAAWSHRVEQMWESPRKKETDADRQNKLYEALLELPDKSLSFLRRFLFPSKHWGLVELFLRKVMLMKDSDITLLREVGTRFAQYARTKSGFFHAFARTNDYSQWRRLVLRAADDTARNGQQPIITYDEFIALFTYREGEYWDWRLARDLIVLLMIEGRVVPQDEILFDDDTFGLPEGGTH